MVALVHNGIIENYYELKLELEVCHKIVFKSETDSEVIVNLISIYYEECKNMKTAIQQTVLKIKGTWALIILNKEEPDTMYCVRHGSSLLIGFNDSYTIISSEKAGFCDYVNNYICLNNADLIILNKNNKEITNYELHYVNKNTEEKLTPYPYSHWTIKEIYEQYETSIRSINFGGRIRENTVNLGGFYIQKN
jgi:glucosamine--fructose-6-phosphate aminotransferase (isomerizing)